MSLIDRSARLLLLSAVLTAALKAQQPLGTWQQLQQLQSGTHIVVVTRHHLSCNLVEVTEDEIVCSRGYRGFTKSRVEEVRLAAVRKGAVIGSLVGGGIGGALASRSSGGNQGVKILAGAGLGAAVGGIIGAVTGTVHGKVIYRR